MNCKRQKPNKATRYSGPDKHGKYNVSESRLRFFLELMVKVSKQEQGNRQINRNFSCLEELVLKQGILFNQTQFQSSWEKPFEQAMMLALGTEKAPVIAYCEGFALFESRPMPVLTAWTWIGNKIIVPNMGIFIGIPVDPDYALEQYLKTGKAGIFSSESRSYYHLLELGIPDEKIVRWIK